MSVMTGTSTHLAMLRSTRPACFRLFYGTREDADHAARRSPGERPFLCGFCYRFHIARVVPHAVPGAGKW